MAVEAIAWAYRQNPKGMAKFTLVTLANWAGKAGHCHGRLAKVAAFTGQTERSVWTHLGELEAAGLIRREVRTETGSRRAIYDFRLPWEAVQDYASERDPHADKRPGTEKPAEGTEPGEPDAAALKNLQTSSRKNFQSSDEKFSSPYKEVTTPDTNSDLASARSGAPGSVLAEPTDLKSRIFGPALDWLADNAGRPRYRLRSLVGRWCRDHGDGRVLEAMTAAARAGAIEPIAWIERKMTNDRDGRRIHGLRGVTTGQAAVAGILDRDP